MDLLEKQNRLDFVKQQLAVYAGEKKESGNSVLVLCPFHAEKTPSGSINIGQSYAPGYFKCWGCGTKARWDDLAPRLGLQPYERGKPKEEHAVDLLMQKGLAAVENTTDKRYVEWKLKTWKLPRNKVWRTIPTNFLLELGGEMCYRWYDEYERWGSTKFIHLPVMINGDKAGYFLARLRKDKEGRPSYILAPSVDKSFGWSKDYGLWPFDYTLEMMRRLKTHTVVLVEGQRDALRLILQGIPAMCIFGTQSWTDNKAKLLEIAGVERALCFFDGDCAGIKATKVIAPRLVPFFEVTKLKLWRMKGSPWLKFEHEDEPTKAAKAAGVTLWDPGNCPQWIIDRIKTKFFTHERG
jgi:hypothetical protein